MDFSPFDWGPPQRKGNRRHHHVGQSDMLRPKRPNVMDEGERGFFVAEGLWDGVPRIYRDLRDALATNYPGHAFELGAFLRFGSWIGGDRDGNPFVTSSVTERTLLLQRRAAIQLHLSRSKELARLLNMSTRQVAASADLCSAVDAACQQSTELAERLRKYLPTEVYRRWMNVIQFRLEQTLDSLAEQPFGRPGPLCYGHAAELESDLQLMVASLRQHNGGRIVDCYLQDWLDRVHIFGLHMAALDVRQDSRVHNEVLTELFQTLQITDNYEQLPEADKQSLLARLLTDLPPAPSGDFSEATQETLALFQLLVKAVPPMAG